MAAYRRMDGLKSPVSLTTCTPGSSLGPTLGNVNVFTEHYIYLPSVSFSKEAGGRAKTVGVMRQRMTDGATNRCDANVGRRRS